VIWLAIGSVLLLLLVIPLCLKVHFSGSASNAGFNFLIKAPGLRIRYDSVSDTTKQRFLWKSARTEAKTAGSAPVPEQTPSPKRKITLSLPKKKSKREANQLALVKLLAPRLWKLMKRLFGAIHADQILAKIIVATDDPMTTAILYGALQPVAAFNSPTRTFLIEADFEKTSFGFELHWSFWARPIVWLWIISTWLLGLPLLRIYRMTRA